MIIFCPTLSKIKMVDYDFAFVLFQLFRQSHEHVQQPFLSPSRLKDNCCPFRMPKCEFMIHNDDLLLRTNCVSVVPVQGCTMIRNGRESLKLIK
ncbi:unnamed protein product, partial [Amoebophrya sp. A25]|eukprot:GSA25T00011005001.1